jgi:hypothetical protein
VSTLSRQITPKRLELLKELVPGLAWLAFLYDGGNAAGGPSRAEVGPAAEALGVRCCLPSMRVRWRI